MSLTARSPFMIVLGLLVMSIWTSEHHHFTLPAPTADSHFLPSVGSNLSIMNFFKFLLISRFLQYYYRFILKNCGLIVKELSGACMIFEAKTPCRHRTCIFASVSFWCISKQCRIKGCIHGIWILLHDAYNLVSSHKIFWLLLTLCLWNSQL